MVKDERESKVYTTRVPKDLADRLDVYIENSDDTKSKTVKHLLEVGLQIEELEGTPQEQKRLINELRDDVDDLEDEIEAERERRANFQAAGAVMTAPLMGIFLLAGLINLLRVYLDITIEPPNEIVGIAFIIVLLGGILYVGLLLGPVMARARERVGI